MPELIHVAGDLGGVFDRATRAVLAAQENLDERLNPGYRRASQWPGHQLFYAVPRAAFDLSFSLTFDRKRRVLFIRRRRGRKSLTHRLRFELVAVPEAPRLPGPIAGGELVEPYFLISAADEDFWATTLIETLKAPANTPGAWRYRDPETDARFESQVHREASRLAADRGMLIFFRLGEGQILVVRVKGKSGGGNALKDGLFLIRPDAEARVTVYAFAGDGVSKVSYEPLHLLALAVRRWLDGRAPDHRSPWRPSAATGLGLEDFDDFVADLERGYRGALGLLASRRDASRLPSHFDLVGVEAELSFAVAAMDWKTNFREWLGLGEEADAADEKDGTEDRAVDRDDGQEDDGGEPAASRLSVRLGRRDGRSFLTVRLEEVEFVLAGADLERLLEQLRPLAAEVADTLAENRGPDGAPASRYRDLLRTPPLGRQVVVFRSYRQKTFLEDLLIIWPGEWGGRRRDFAFTIRRQGTRLSKIKKVLALEQPLRAVTVDPLGESSVIDRRAYQAFHRFFVATGLWRRRGAAS